jgi:DegV family protein with EDD domain
MSCVCILTDSTAQFTRAKFPGHERVFVAPFDPEPVARQGSALPPRSVSVPRFAPPSVEKFLDQYRQLSSGFDSILVITVSSRISPVYRHACTAAAQLDRHVSVEVLDSQTTGAGLGWLVETAAAAASRGDAPGEILKQVRTAIPRTYALFFTPELEVLVAAGQISQAQAIAAGIMGLLPIFLLEDGCLLPLAKVRSRRTALEYFEEFLEEFQELERVTLLFGESTTPRTRLLSQHIQQAYCGANFSQHAIGLSLASLFGAQSIGLAVLAKD